ncbi:uncharacterized protein LOC119729846 [Patiria miniata]|uniref:C-type lectin domain-containing protein n=1 Tax=Patiria miniata TaxID=46514 RepID=A0A914A3Y8_PATMI|nr:uncharacterized protein LOC119729846 [Patiria miniata]
MPSMNQLEFAVCVQLVMICVHLNSLPVMCQESYGGVRQRRTAQGSGGAATCECRTESATLTCSEEPTDCDDDEVSHRGSCYRFIRDDRMSRDDAHRDCIARNSHLVYIETEEEQTFLANHSESLIGSDNRNNVRNHYWIGLIPTSSNVWLDGNQANNDMFEISQDSAAGCFSVYKSSGKLLLHGENCDQNHYFICERPRECSLGVHVNHNSTCYWISESWWLQLSAKGFCTNNGGHLLYIESQDELQFINSNLPIVDGVRYWIGLTTQYAWMDGSRAIYQGFAQSQYSNNKGSLCFRLHPADAFLWYDRVCSQNYAYICEREIPVLSSQERQNPGISCRPPVADLDRLLDSIPLCVRSDSHYFNNYVLCQCNNDETCISGCGCARDNTVARFETIRCNCGFCSFTFDESGDDRVGVWPSNFSCTCSVNGTSSNVTVVNGEFACVPDDSESMTTLGDNRNDQHTTSVTSSTPTTAGQGSTEERATERPATTGITVGQSSTEDGAIGRPVTADKPMTTVVSGGGGTVGSGGGGGLAGQTGVPIGVPVGVTLALLFLLVVLVVGFILWRRREKKNNKGIDKPLTTNTLVAGSNVNPTYGLDEDDHVTDDILKPVAAVRPRVPKSKPNNVYADVKPNDQSTSAAGTSEAESYATIQSAGYTPYTPDGQKDVYTALQGTRNNNEDRNAPIPSNGYTAYKPKRGNDVYTDLKKTGNNDDDDDPAVYTPIPNNGPKQDKDDPENEYVDPEYVMVAPSVQRNGAGGVKAPVPLPKPKNLTKDSGYVSVDAPIGDSASKGRAGYVDVDAPSVEFSDGSKPSARSKKPGSGYVSVDSPSATFASNQDDDPENAYYFKLEKPPADDEDDYSLASAPRVNDYDTFNRAGGKRSSANSPTDDGVYNLTSVPEDNEYNTFHRPGKRRPSNNAPTDDGLYSLTSVPEGNEYNTFNRPGVRRPSNNAPTDDGLYSLTNPPGDDEYSTFDRLGNRGPSANAPTDEGVYSLTGPPEGDVYSTANRVGKKRTPGAPAINNESEYSTLD